MKRPVRIEIKKMADIIVEKFHPEQVILFGSHARGDAGPDSDVDLLVVMPLKGRKHKKAVEIGLALHEIQISKDIVVTTPDDFEWRNEVTGTYGLRTQKERSCMPPATL